MTWRGAGFVAAGMLLVAACARVPPSRAPGPPPTPNLTAADTLRARGCLLCLRDAEAAYVAAAWPGADARLFETEILLAVRSRELGLDASPLLDRARATGARLPAAWPVDTYLAIADGVPPGPNAVSTAEQVEGWLQRRVSAARVPEWVAWLTSGPASPDVNAYLAVALACGRRADTLIDVVTRALADHPDSPLVKYAAGTCDARFARLLQEVREAEPRYGEASLHLGRYAMARLGGLDPRRTGAYLDEAYATLATVPAVTFTVAGLHSLRRDWPNMLRFNDETIVLAPAQFDAWLGRVIALSHLARHDDAMAAASTILASGTGDRAQAFYWRGWNAYQLGRLDPAREDADAARRLSVNTHAETLAGVVAYDEQRFSDARAHLREAWRLDNRNCAAAWHLGRAEAALAAFVEAAPAFVAAVACYDAAVAELRAELESLRVAEDRPPDLRDRQVAEQERTIAETRSQALVAAFGAGSSLVRAKRPAEAVPYLRRALDDPDLRDRATALLRQIAPR